MFQRNYQSGSALPQTCTAMIVSESKVFTVSFAEQQSSSAKKQT